jgi:hypothetical protein
MEVDGERPIDHEDRGNGAATVSLATMPPEIIVMVLALVRSARDLMAMRSVCTEWRHMLGPEGPMGVLCRGRMPADAIDALAGWDGKDDEEGPVGGGTRDDGADFTPLPLCVAWALLADEGIGRLGPRCTRRMAESHRVDYWGWPSGNTLRPGLALSRVDGDGRAVRCARRQRPRVREWYIGTWSAPRAGRSSALRLWCGLASGTVFRPHANMGGLFRGWGLPRGLGRWDSLWRTTTRWTGRVAAGRPHGRGVWEVFCADEHTGAAVCIMRMVTRGDGPADIYYPTAGCGYRGQVSGGRFHGRGTLTTRSGSVYRGEWRFGLPHGRGTMRRAAPRDPGPYNEEDRVGIEPGAVYEGDWSDGRRWGRGIQRWADGRTYAGQWANGRPHGYGEERSPDGTVRRGTWVRGLLHGKAMVVHEDGRSRRAYYIEGEPCSRLVFREYEASGDRRAIGRCVLGEIGRAVTLVGHRAPARALGALGRLIDEYTIVGDLRGPFINF